MGIYSFRPHLFWGSDCFCKRNRPEQCRLQSFGGGGLSLLYGYEYGLIRLNLLAVM